nr:ribonuclease H-like domain-containing protein [Tanacetum cinerariifolium]
MTLLNTQRHVVPPAVLTQTKLVPINVVRPVSTVVPKIKVTRPRQDKPIVTKTNSPPRRLVNRSPSPKASNSPPIVTALKARMVNAAKVVQGKWEWKSKCPILDHVSRNTSASMTLKRFDYNDALGRSKSVMAWFPKRNQPSYFLCREQGVIDSECSRHMTGNMSYLSDFEEINGRYVAFGGNPKGGKISGKVNQSNPSAGVQEQFDAEKAREDNVQQYVLFPLWSFSSKDPQNTDGDAAFEVKEPEFKGKKPESEVHVFPRKFEDISDNSINEVIAAGTPVPAVGKILTNSTNTFSAAGPFNTVVSPTHGKSSYMDPSQYPDDPNMPALKDITYSDDEEDVGAEADITNLETNITISHIPTTRVHKYHHVT